MIVAVPYEDGNVFQHFGHTKQFKLYAINGASVVGTGMGDVGDISHDDLAELLAYNKIDVVICGGIGEGAKKALEKKSILVLAGVEGDADRAVMEFLADCLAFSEGITCGGCGGHDGGCGGGCGGGCCH